MRNQALHSRKLRKKLQQASRHRSPRHNDRQVVLAAARAVGDKARDDRGIPQHRHGIRKKETAMTVQNPQAPRRKHQQSRAGEQNAHQRNGQFPLLSVEARCDHIN